MIGGGGTGGFKPPACRTLLSRFPPCIFWLPPLCIFAIAKYCAMLRNFPFFSRFPPLFSRLPYTSRPLFSQSPAPLSPLPLDCLLETPPVSGHIRVIFYMRVRPVSCAVEPEYNKLLCNEDPDIIN